MSLIIVPIAEMEDAVGLVAMTPWLKLYPAGILVSVIGAYGPWSNLCVVPAFGDKEQAFVFVGKYRNRQTELESNLRSHSPGEPAPRQRTAWPLDWSHTNDDLSLPALVP
jgi:hypothetical protein